MVNKPSVKGYQQRLSLLRQQFLASVESKQEALLSALAAIRSGEHTGIETVIQVAHQLAGSCGTFGLPELGTKAKHVEQLAIDIRNTSDFSPIKLNALQNSITLFCELNAQVSAHQGGGAEPVSIVLASVEEVWLLLDDERIVSDLNAQLQGFGYKVLVLESYLACAELLAERQPVALILEDQLGNNGACFFGNEQLLLLLKKQSVCWFLYSTVDTFEARVKAVNALAAGFLTAPLDIASTVTHVSQQVNLNREKGGKVCIVDDDALLAEKYALALETHGIDCLVVSKPESLIENILSYRPELVLMDLHMPRYSGVELAGVIRQYEALRGLPIVYLSAESDLSQQLNAMSYGADDFLLKPLTDTQLVKAVTIRLARSRQIKMLIERDGLTGLLKHTAIKEAANVEVERASRSGAAVSVAMIDLDNFKQVNDTYGHSVGDAVISALASLIIKRIRKSDKAGRYGGEEFLLILPECTAEESLNVVESILASFREIEFRADGKVFHCTFSAGISTLNEQTQISDTLIQRADENLYAAKEAGRNNVVVDSKL